MGNTVRMVGVYLSFCKFGIRLFLQSYREISHLSEFEKGKGVVFRFEKEVYQDVSFHFLLGSGVWCQLTQFGPGFSQSVG